MSGPSQSTPMGLLWVVRSNSDRTLHEAVLRGPGGFDALECGVALYLALTNTSPRDGDLDHDHTALLLVPHRCPTHSNKLRIPRHQSALTPTGTAVHFTFSRPPPVPFGLDVPDICQPVPLVMVGHGAICDCLVDVWMLWQFMRCGERAGTSRAPFLRSGCRLEEHAEGQAEGTLYGRHSPCHSERCRAHGVSTLHVLWPSAWFCLVLCSVAFRVLGVGSSALCARACACVC